MVSVPPQLTSFQGFDALFHSIEGYLANIATPMSDLYALESIRLIADSALAFNDNCAVGIVPNQARIQENLDKVLPAQQFYFKDNNPDFLQVVRVEGERVIGKKVPPGTPVKEISDNAENIRSILRKICPDYGFTELDIKVFAQTLIG